VFAAAEQAVIEAEGYLKTDLDSNTTIAEKSVKLTSDKGQIEADKLTYNGNSGIVNASGKVKLTSPTGIILQAEQLVYNINTKEAQFSGGVQMTVNDGLTITAAQLDYHGAQGLIRAIGGVKIVSSHGTYETETLDYNLNDATGSSGPIRTTINATDRNFIITGDAMETTNDITKITSVRITRCQMPHPETLIVAKEAKYDGQYLYLKSVVAYIKGIPVFYYPLMTLDVNNLKFPNIEPGYNQDDGLYIKYHDSVALSKNIDWHFSGELRTHDYSSLVSGITVKNGNISDYAGFYYYTESAGYGVEERLTYDRPLVTTTIDGSKSFSSNNAYQLGLSITRKYWESPLGKWQFGVLGRKVYELEGSDVEYGGTYDGYRLDYTPHPYVTLSLLRLYSCKQEDYGYGDDFMDEFKIGSNLMYNVGIPLRKAYSLSLNGTYNVDQSLWIHQIYQINHQTDCIFITFGWDEAEKSTTFSGHIKF
jgi:hypothetical protein